MVTWVKSFRRAAGIVYQGCHGTGKTGNWDVHFSRHRNLLKIFVLPEEFTPNTEKIKGCTRIVVENSYNLLALKQIMS